MWIIITFLRKERRNFDMNLPLKLSHSFNFLRDFLSSTEDIMHIVDKCMREISLVKPEESDSKLNLRTLSNKARESIDKIEESYSIDSDLFVDDFRFIIHNKMDEDVIYYLGKFKSTLSSYKKTSKVLDKMNNELQDAVDECSYDKDYIRMLAYTKIHTPIKSILKDFEGIISRLKVLVGDSETNEDL
jgi:hypothetical protein